MRYAILPLIFFHSISCYADKADEVVENLISKYSDYKTNSKRAEEIMSEIKTELQKLPQSDDALFTRNLYLHYLNEASKRMATKESCRAKISEFKLENYDYQLTANQQIEFKHVFDLFQAACPIN